MGWHAEHPPGRGAATLRLLIPYTKLVFFGVRSLARTFTEQMSLAGLVLTAEPRTHHLLVSQCK